MYKIAVSNFTRFAKINVGYESDVKKLVRHMYVARSIMSHKGEGPLVKCEDPRRTRKPLNVALIAFWMGFFSGQPLTKEQVLKYNEDLIKEGFQTEGISSNKGEVSFNHKTFGIFSKNELNDFYKNLATKENPQELTILNFLRKVKNCHPIFLGNFKNLILFDLYDLLKKTNLEVTTENSGDECSLIFKRMDLKVEIKIYKGDLKNFKLLIKDLKTSKNTEDVFLMKEAYTIKSMLFEKIKEKL